MGKLKRVSKTGGYSEEEAAKLAKKEPPPPPADVVQITDEESQVVTYGRLRHDLSEASMEAIERKIAHHHVANPLRPVEVLLHYKNIGWQKEPRLDYKASKGEMYKYLGYLCHKHVGTIGISEFDHFMNSMEQSAIFQPWLEMDKMSATNPSEYDKRCIQLAQFGQLVTTYTYGKFPKEKKTVPSKKGWLTRK